MVWHNQSCHVAARDNATETINSWCGVGSLDAASPRPSFASDEGEGEKVMGTKKDEILAIAREQGYDGPAPATTKQATVALADTLAGETVGGATTISEAIGKLGEHIGGGSESVEYGPQVVDLLRLRSMANRNDAVQYGSLGPSDERITKLSVVSGLEVPTGMSDIPSVTNLTMDNFSGANGGMCIQFTTEKKPVALVAFQSNNTGQYVEYGDYSDQLVILRTVSDGNVCVLRVPSFPTGMTMPNTIVVYYEAKS